MWRLTRFGHGSSDRIVDGFGSAHPPGSLRYSIDLIRGQLRMSEKLTFNLLLILFLVILIYTVGVWLGSEGTVPLIVLALCGLVAVCGVAGGGALGFLFGIPRLLQHQDSRTDPDKKDAAGNGAKAITQPYIRSNSNLEEISDWLTKILVGLGLIHLSALPGYIHNYRAWLEGMIVFTVASPPGLSMALLSVTFASAAIGFLFFYIETRTRITLLLLATETVRGRPTNEEAQAVWQRPQFTIEGATVARDIKPAAALSSDAIVDDRMPATSDSADMWAAWAANQVRAGRLSEAAFGWRTAIERDAMKNAQLREKYAEVLLALDKDAEALKYFEEARRLGGDEERLLCREL